MQIDESVDLYHCEAEIFGYVETMIEFDDAVPKIPGVRSDGASAYPTVRSKIF